MLPFVTKCYVRPRRSATLREMSPNVTECHIAANRLNEIAQLRLNRYGEGGGRRWGVSRRKNSPSLSLLDVNPRYGARNAVRTSHRQRNREQPGQRSGFGHVPRETVGFDCGEL